MTNPDRTVLDLFSAAAGGWSLGMHRAGFRTIAACELLSWRRELYAQNNPGVRIYEDIRTLTADRLVRDGIGLPWAIVGSPPCQGVSSANTKGKGLDDARSALFFEAIRLAGECGARWVALENSANLRTRGADRVIASLEALGYTCWSFVVRAGHGRGGAGIGANHERPRSWIIAFNGDTDAQRRAARVSHPQAGAARDVTPGCVRPAAVTGGHGAFSDADSDKAGWAHGQMEPGLRATQIAQHGRPDGRGDAAPHSGEDHEHAGASHAEMGECESSRDHAGEPWPHWNGSFAGHLRMDDGLSAWLACARVVVSSPAGASAARLIVEAYGDAVVPQIPETIGRAILRVEAALSAVKDAA